MAVMVAPIPEEAFRLFSGIRDDVGPTIADLSDWLGDVHPNRHHADRVTNMSLRSLRIYLVRRTAF